MTTPTPCIRIFLVDDHPIVRAGVSAWLSAHPQFAVVGEAESGEQALRLVPGVAPDVVLLDLSLPGLGGIETAAALRQRLPTARLVALSMHEDPEYVQRFLAAGGSGYVPKSSVETQLLDAVMAVMRGEHYIPAALWPQLESATEGAVSLHDARLTQRELEVIKGIARGNTYREIAEMLSISEKTVATYRERAASKLGVTHRAGLVRWVLAQRLLE